jgi:hypothetical protein
MTDSRAVGFDRLPWLSEEPERPAKIARWDLAGWAVAAVLAVAGGSYWLGTQSVDEPVPSMEQRTVPRSTTVPLPAPQVIQPQVEPDRIPEVALPQLPSVAVAKPRAERTARKPQPSDSSRRAGASASDEARTESTAAKSTSAATSPPATRAKPLTLWPAREAKGASGRLVQIGAFGTRQQAKLGWRYMQRSYPAVSRLPAVVVEARNSRGRRFYRFQIGTTSQAHSEVLCQRMEKIRLSCAVVGLPGAKKAVER